MSAPLWGLPRGNSLTLLAALVTVKPQFQAFKIGVRRLPMTHTEIRWSLLSEVPADRPATASAVILPGSCRLANSTRSVSRSQLRLPGESHRPAQLLLVAHQDLVARFRPLWGLPACREKVTRSVGRTQINDPDCGSAARHPVEHSPCSTHSPPGDTASRHPQRMTPRHPHPVTPHHGHQGLERARVTPWAQHPPVRRRWRLKRCSD